MSNLTRWARRSPSIAEHVALTAVQTIVTLFSTPSSIKKMDGAPYSIITLFLCHVVLWIFARISTPQQKIHFLSTVSQIKELEDSDFFAVLKKGMESEEMLLFKRAAELLTQVGTWGAALNLALLLHRRSEIQ
jgi:hypothetical protein